MVNKFYIVFIFIVLHKVSLGQISNRNAADTSTTNKTLIRILQADRLNFEELDTANKYQSAAGNVVLKQENTLFYCDSVVLNKLSNLLEAFGKVHINDADSVNIYSDYLKYIGSEKKAYLNKNVKLTDGRGVLTTNELEYDIATRTGIYKNGGKVINKKTILTSKEGTYNGELRDFYFRKNVQLIDPKYKLTTDSLLYNTYSEVATFVTATTIKTKTQQINTASGYYDLRNKKTYFGKRPLVVDGATILIADEIATDEASGFGEASGNVVLKDTTEGMAIYANNIKTNRKNSSFIATQKPVAVIKQGVDSFFISADTLFSAKLSDILPERSVSNLATDTLSFISKAMALADSGKNRIVEAYYHVRIFSDSMQAVGDSLFYTSYDSVFRLFTNPIAWAQGNQISGDTLYIFTEKQQPKQIKVFENALAINKAGADYLNQVKGRSINGFFKDGNIYYLRAKGMAESVYYPVDDSKRFIGVNKLNADAIELYFENKKPEKIKPISGVKGKMYPMLRVNHQEIKLKGVNWQESKRPKSKAELFE